MAPQQEQSASQMSTMNTMDRQLQPAVTATPPAGIPCALPHAPTVYYLCQPASTYVWVPYQTEQPVAHYVVPGPGAYPVSGVTSDHVELPTHSAVSDVACGGLVQPQPMQQPMAQACASWCPSQNDWQSGWHHSEEASEQSSSGIALDPYAFEMKKCISVDEASIGGSTCSTAPSTQRRGRKQRARPAQRQAAAERHRQAVDQTQKILQEKASYTRRLEAGGEASTAAIKELYGAVWLLSVDADGCRLVQLAIERARGQERARLVEGLHGHVREAMGSPHANYVIQKVVAAMPLEVASFIAKELSGIAAEVCRHRYGCRILCRLIEQFGSSACVSSLVEEMMEEICSLIQHTFGRYVVQAVLEHGLAAHRHCIADGLAMDILSHATSRNGSYVVESAFRNCNDSDVAMLAAKVVAEDVLVLSQDQFGIYVVRALMDMPGDVADCIFCQLNNAPPSIQHNKHFQRLLELLRADKDDDDDEDEDADGGEDEESC